MIFKKGSTGFAIIVSIILVGLLVLGGFLAYKYGLLDSLFEKEQLPQQIIPEIPPVDTVVRFVDYKTQQDVPVSYTIYEKISGQNIDDNCFNISSTGFADNQTLFKFPVNRTYYVMGHSDDYYGNYVAIVVYPRSLLYSSKVNLHKKAKEINYYLSNDLVPNSINRFNLTINTSDEIRNIGICMDWNFGVVYSKILDNSLKEILPKPKRMGGYEKCYQTDITIFGNKNIIIPMEVKLLDITPADFLKINILDQERPFINCHIDYVYEDSFKNDVGAKDFEIDLLEKFK